MLAGVNRPLAGIVKSFSDLMISESYQGLGMIWGGAADPDDNGPSLVARTKRCRDAV